MENIRICCWEENGTIFQKEGFSFFCYETIEIRCGRRREELYIPLIVRYKREEGFLFFFFLRGTFEVVEKKLLRYFITLLYYTFSFSTKYQNVMKRRIKAYRRMYHLRET